MFGCGMQIYSMCFFVLRATGYLYLVNFYDKPSYSVMARYGRTWRRRRKKLTQKQTLSQCGLIGTTSEIAMRKWMKKKFGYRPYCLKPVFFAGMFAEKCVKFLPDRPLMFMLSRWMSSTDEFDTEANCGSVFWCILYWAKDESMFFLISNSELGDVHCIMLVWCMPSLIIQQSYPFFNGSLM